MWRFLLGITLVGAVMWIAVLVLARTQPTFFIVTPNWLALLLALVVVPFAVCWIETEVIHAVRPRRLFCGRRRQTGSLLARGVATSVMAYVIAAVGLAFLDRVLSDGLILSGAFAIVTPLVVVALPRRRSGHCIYCNYDLRGTPLAATDRCTECGVVCPI